MNALMTPARSDTDSTLKPMIEVRGLTKHYGSMAALDSVSLSVRKGEFVTLLGPSGSGKSTLLNLISGMATPSHGEIFIDGINATHLPTNERGLGMVFQNYALMPHMTVFQNIAFPLQVRNVGKAEIRERVMAVLKLIQLEQVAERRPRELSGGQQQRISLARCIVYNPALILMDEPLGALDKKLREDMQLEIKRLHGELGVTMLYVTHDQDEALTMSDRIVLMRNGKIEQEGEPESLYFKPESVFTADFIGSSNLFHGSLVDTPEGLCLRTPMADLRLATGHPALAGGADAVLLVRPENIRFSQPGSETEQPSLPATLKDSVVMGGVVRHFLDAAGGLTVIAQELNQPGRERLARGSAVSLTWHPSHARLLPPPPSAPL